MAQNEKQEGTVPSGGSTSEVAGQPVTEPASPAPARPDESTLVLQVVERLINGIGLRARLDMTRKPDGYYINIEARRATALLIGHRGATLKSIQYLARLIVRRDYPDVPPVTVDVAGYAERRDHRLRQKATAVARIVLRTHREMALDMLTEKDMRVVQDELASMPGVRVHAVGDGPRRYVVISPSQASRGNDQ